MFSRRYRLPAHPEDNLNENTAMAARERVRHETGTAFAALALRGYTLAPQTGLYPRVHAECARGEVVIAIDFWISLDEGGRRRTVWRDDVPFELGGAVSLTRDEGGVSVRYWRPYVHYTRPYRLALETLEADLGQTALTLEAWASEDMVSMGKRFVIRT
jgi:hypothetical protein